MRFALACVCVALSLLTSVASAEPAHDESAAADWKRRADDLLDRKRYAEAVDAYTASYAAFPDAAVLYNRGRALQFVGRYSEALAAIEQFSVDAPPATRARVPGLADLLADLRSRVGTLSLRADIDGARVLVDGTLVGITPLPASVRLGAGHLSVEAFVDGYYPVHQDVDLPGNGFSSVKVHFVPRSTFGLVRIESRRPGAVVLVDDETLGLAPVEAGLTAGAHRIRVRHPGFDEALTGIVVRAGESRRVVLDPVARPAITSRVWFWGAVAGVVAIGVVSAILLTTERSAGTGDYAPGTIHF